MRGERGFASAVWLVGVTLVVLPLAVIGLSLPRWFERADLAHALAQDLARTVARAPDLEAGHALAADAAGAVATAAGLSLDPGCVRSCLRYRIAGELARSSVITVTVTVDLPRLEIPFVGTIQPDTWTVAHHERVDDFRSLP